MSKPQRKTPRAGVHVMPPDPLVGSSTVTEVIASEKVGSGAPSLGRNETIDSLDRALKAIADRLLAGGAVPRFVGARLGSVETVAGGVREVDVTMEATPAVLYDAVVVPDGAAAVQALSVDGRALEFVKDQYRHCTPMLILGAASQVLAKAGIPDRLPSGDRDPGLVLGGTDGAAAAGAFLDLLARHRQFARETDPPRV